MKSARLSLLPLLFGALAMLALSLPAQAQPGQGGGRFLRDRAAQRQLPPRRADADERLKRDDRAGDEVRRRELTPEERRELRRDIRDAGRDLYRPERPLRRFPRRQF